MSSPPVQYASSGEAEIAYQVLGEGPPDVVWIAGSITHLDVWEQPPTAASASSSRPSHG